MNSPKWVALGWVALRVLRVSSGMIELIAAFVMLETPTVQGPHPTADRTIGTRHATTAGVNRVEPLHKARSFYSDVIPNQFSLYVLPPALKTVRHPCGILAFTPGRDVALPQGHCIKRQCLQACDHRRQRCFSGAWLPCAAPQGPALSQSSKQGQVFINM